MRGSILVVDDQTDFLDSVTMLFEAYGYQVTGAKRGDEAVALVTQGLRPDVVLLDFRMPGMTGQEALAQMRLAGLLAPAVLVSGCVDPETAIAAGFDFGVLKSDLPALTACIQQAVLRVEAGSHQHDR
jgi:CheY-like chemotaxis protein